MRRVRALLALTLLMTAVAAAPPRAQTPVATPEALFKDDVHAQAGLACSSCHTSGAAPYGPVERTKIAPLCATCHANAEYMKTYNPQVRVDQYQQYLTSTHGKRMSAGETRVATCSDCHGAHGIRPVSDARSPVAPPNVATTCSKCHSDHARMSLFGHEGNPPEDWKASVHAAALLKRGDTSAPTCSTCHGSHGAAPPGVTSVALVCAQCHVREAELFRKSPKKAIFDLIGQGECLTCHSNHRIQKPADSFIGLQEPALCATCHNEEMNGAAVITAMQKGLSDLDTGIVRANAVLDRAGQRRDARRRRTARTARCARRPDPGARQHSRVRRQAVCRDGGQRASPRRRAPRRSATPRWASCATGATASPSPRCSSSGSSPRCG